MRAKEDEVLAEGRFMGLARTGQWEYAYRVGTDGAVVLIAVTPEERLLLVEQFRPALRKRVLELPAGLSGDDEEKRGEALAEAAQRELIEETGYRAGRMIELRSGPASAGLSSETMTFFLAEDLEKVGAGGGDAQEDIVVHEVPLGEVERWLEEYSEETGCLVDLKIFSGLYFALARRGNR